ncbi:DNA-directed RNA polymerases II 24 kDa polypeptide (RNA polymerase II subunit 5), partial [Cladochytrium tenue]
VEQLIHDIEARVAALVSSASVSRSGFNELEVEMETIVALRLADLRELAATQAQSAPERERYTDRYRVLSEEFRRVNAWLYRERSENDRSWMQRDLQRELDDVLRMQAEFAKISHDATLAITGARRGSAPNISAAAEATSSPHLPSAQELVQAVASLETRFSWYDTEVSRRLADLEPRCRDFGLLDRHAALARKWAGVRLMKERIAEEGQRRAAARRLAPKPSRTLIPRVAVSRIPELHRSSTVGAAILSARRTPSPTRLANPNDPLDVEVARVVNSCPVSIKVVQASDGRGYWFGDLMPKLSFCRVVREGVVMVRVGGGWQELGKFLQEHSTLEARLPTVRSFAPDAAVASGASGHSNEGTPEGSFVVLSATDVTNPYDPANYLVGDHELNMSLDEFKQQHMRGQIIDRSSLTFLVEHKSENDQILIFFTEDETVGIKPLKKIWERMMQQQIMKAILIYQKNLTPSAHKIIHEMAPKYILEIFQESELLVNITHHTLVPRHVLLTKDEKATLLARYRLKETQLPRIQPSDPVARYYGLKRGEVVKITRPSETAGKYVTYRLCW